jgi:hypothetical protein
VFFEIKPALSFILSHLRKRQELHQKKKEREKERNGTENRKGNKERKGSIKSANLVCWLLPSLPFPSFSYMLDLHLVRSE